MALDGAAIFPKLQAAGSCNNMAGGAAFPSLSAAGTFSIAPMVDGAATFAPLQAAGKLGGFYGTGLFQPLQASGTVTASIPILDGAASFKALRAESILGVPTAFSQAWVFNTRNNAVSRYGSFLFNSMAAHNGTYIAAGTDGFYELSGGTTPAAWSVDLGIIDFGELCRLTDAFLDLTSDAGTITVSLSADDGPTYTVDNVIVRTGVRHTQRIKLPGGLVGRFWRIGVSAADGHLSTFHGISFTRESFGRRA